MPAGEPEQLNIVFHPHPALRWKSREVTRIDSTLKQWVSQMFDLMYEANGIGLAANQVALPYRLFVMNPSGDPERKEEERVVVNPIIRRRAGSDEYEEGCLSLPEIHGDVTRPDRITVEYFDLAGNEVTEELSGLPSRVVQHELDHLDGVLFVDYLAEAQLAEVEPLLEDLTVQFRHAQSVGSVPSDPDLKAVLRQLQTART